MLRKYLGDSALYRRAAGIALPIIAQNAITNFVSMLDNIMVGQLSTAQISAVNIVNNNLLFMFMLCMFGAAAGAGIFTTQFHGSGDNAGIAHSFRYKLLTCIVLTLVGGGLLLGFGDALIGLYLQGEGDPTLAADTLRYGKEYLNIMLIGLLPFALTNAYAGTLRECGRPTVPMVASMIATGVNLVLNYILIFGHFGAPAMGVAGAAWATVTSRFAELGVVAAWTHLHPEENPYIRGVYRSFRIPGRLFKTITIKGMPLLLNEAAFGLGMAILNQCYSLCGLEVVPALSIATTIYNLAAVIFRSLGNTVGIILGQMMGASRPEKEIRHTYHSLTFLCIVSGVVFAGVLAAFSGLFPLIYNTTDSVRRLASALILISAVTMPMQAYIFPVYFTLRAGGKTLITFLFDSGAIWLLSIPLAFVLCRFTALPVTLIYGLCYICDAIKCFLGARIIKKGDWIQNLAH